MTRWTSTEAHPLLLGGIDGANPLGFLAALGTLRAASEADPSAGFRLGWELAVGAWRPRLEASRLLDTDELVGLLDGWLSGRQDRTEFGLGSGQSNINVEPDVFRGFATAAVKAARPGDRTAADFAAAFGCDATVDRQGRVENTALRTMSGSGHQHFLGFMRNIIEACGPEHLARALFQTWRYDDPIRNLSMRWDPLDDVRYALRWSDPSSDGDRKNRGSMLGANRLAIEALPLFTTVPRSDGLHTIGFNRPRRGEPSWRWPIWNPAVPLAVAGSLLALAELREDVPPHADLRARGVAVVFESRRVRPSDYYRNFAPGVAV